jgi:CDP-diacylglycerol---glycerol-3-phosphate 3-phosphatidyltransferase
MILTVELKYTLVVAVIVLLLAAAYGLRVAVKGRVHFDRIDHQGGSRLLSKGVMELGYWILYPVARLLVFLGVTPNKVSWASLGFGFLAGACLSMGHFGFGSIFATISGLLDSVDGIVARISGLVSHAGEVLDAAVDRYVEFFFLSGLAIYYREIPVLQVLALVTLLGSFMVSYSTAKAEALKVDLPRGSMRRPERAVYLSLGAALSTITIYWLETHHELSVPIGYPMVMALGLVAVVANVSAIKRLWSIVKALRVREKDGAEARTRAAEEILRQEQEGSEVSQQSANIRL